MGLFHLGLWLPSALVHCHCSLLWEVPPQGSKGKSRACSICNCSFDLFCCSIDHIGGCTSVASLNIVIVAPCLLGKIILCAMD
ncbi:hypothetical protein MUK42_32829 [Musa troglodytarum]|uniref:Secreted protein n=1 Tax=Musa troglodytarum TaxID=320322 RepID=A0A9E7F8C9_9LILI|nr:hypothetical protein MUK42_32829 [Musa troglodytarum]